MDFLVGLLSPALGKVLEISFLTGYATCYRLETAKRLRGGIPILPPVKYRQRGLSKASSGLTDTLASTASLQFASQGSMKDAKGLPNDAQRQGNIWQRYEQLETATKSLSGANQQLVDERALHKKEKKLLEDTIVELRTQRGGASTQGIGVQTSPLSDSSKAVLRELDTPEEERFLMEELNEAKAELQRLTEEMSDAHNQLEFLRSENQALATENNILQRKVGSEPAGRRRPSIVGAAVSPATPFAKEGSVGAFADEVATVAAAKRGVPAQTTGSSLTSFGSDIETQLQRERLAAKKSDELDRPAATGGDSELASLKSENKVLQERISMLSGVASGAVGGGAFVGDSNNVKKLQEMNRKLTDENQRLQKKILRVDQEPARVMELEEKYAKLLEENTRLQSKVVRLNLGAPQAGAGDSALVEELKAENDELKEDNDKLVAYLEALEKKKKDLEDFVAQSQASQGSGTVAGTVNQFVQLKNDNMRLAEENTALKKKLEDPKFNSQGSYTTVPIPVRVETGEEMDKDLWMLVEELRDQNRALIEELTAAKGKSPKPATADQADSRRVEELQRQLAAVMDSKAAEINEDNIRLVDHLSEENSQLQEEVIRLNKKLANSIDLADGEVLRDAISSSERLLAEKRQVDLQCRRLADKNTRLIHENEGLLKQLSADGSSKVTESLKAISSPQHESRPAQKSLLSKFSRNFRRKGGKEKSVDTEEDLQPSSTEASISSTVSNSKDLSNMKDMTGASRQLVQELIEENTKLFEENKRLGSNTASARDVADVNQKLQEENMRLQAGMGLVKDLTEENSKLVDENQRLTESVNKYLEENREMSNRIINVAFQNEEDMFDAAFGDFSGATQAGRGGMPAFDTSEVVRRHQELAEQMRIAGEQQKKDAARRRELSTRASHQLEAYEAARRSGGASHKKSAASAMARLSNMSQRGQELRPDSSPLSNLEEEEQELLSAGRMSHGSLEGTFDEAKRRRKEADLARAELSKKIEASRKRIGDSPPGSSLPPSFPRRDVAPRQPSAIQQQAEDKVRKAFHEYAGNDDLGSFMEALGYPGFSSVNGQVDEGELLAVYQKAMSTAAGLRLCASGTLSAFASYSPCF